MRIGQGRWDRGQDQPVHGSTSPALFAQYRKHAEPVGAGGAASRRLRRRGRAVVAGLRDRLGAWIFDYLA
jgi:hypothetical protein